jgi:predicted permease
VHSADKGPPAWRRYLRFWGTNSAADVDAELEFHVASRVEELIAEGKSRDAATSIAMREFGDYASVRREVNSLESAYERRRGFGEWIADVGRDVARSVRSLRKSPAFSAVVIVTLALGIGLNSTIFSLVNAYLFRPVDLPAADRLVALGNTSALLKQPHEMPYRDIQAYRELGDVFEDLIGTLSETESLNENDRTERLWSERTTGNYFTTLRVPMHLGRSYDASASANAEPVIVLSHEFWVRRFAADSAIVGRTLRVEGQPRTVIGVAARSFVGFAPMIRTDAWSPIDESPAARARMLATAEGDWFNVYGVLRGGVSVQLAREALLARAGRLQKEFPASNRDVVPVIVPETRARPVLAIAAPVPLMAGVLLALTLLVLAVACANVASLLLARGTGRAREFAVRSALGASRWRLTREALLEAGLLSLAGAIGAFAMARWSTARLAGIRPATDAPLLFDFTPDWRVFGFTLAAAIAATLLAGLGPALRNGNASPQSVLTGGGRLTDRVHQRLRSLIVVGQIAVSVVVLVAAGLFSRSMRAAETMELGFTTSNILMAQFDLSLSGYDSPRATAFQRDVLARVRALPGVKSAALAARIPFGYSNNAMKVVGDTPRPDAPEGDLVFMNMVSTDYFRTSGPEIARGREFTEADNVASDKVAVVNEILAERLWPGQDALGKVMRLPSDSMEVRVVGIARNAQYMFLNEPPRPFFWLALAQQRRFTTFVEVATIGSPSALIPALRNAVRELDPNVPLFEVRSMEQHLREGRAMFAVRMGAVFGSTFALLALVLAAVGVYGLVSYSVSHRTREIGIRMAVGAAMRDVVSLVLGQALTLAVAGVGLGVLAAVGATRGMAALLYGVHPFDPLTFGTAALVLGAIAVAASWMPARRAARVDPATTLRSE